MTRIDHAFGVRTQPIVLALLLVLGLAQCGGSDGPTSPDERPLFNFTPTGAPEFTKSLVPIASNADVQVELGTYPYPTLAVVSVTGVLERYYSNSPGWNFPPPTGDLREEHAGSVDAGGQFNGSTNQCHARVRVTFSQGGGELFCDYYNQLAVKNEWADTSIMKGAGIARWDKGPASFLAHCDGTGKPPCFTYANEHEVKVTPVPASLVLRPNRYVTHPGKPTVTFKARRTPATFGPHLIPFSVQSWAWEPDSGAASGPACSSDTTCVFTPSVSGTMTLTAIVNGTLQSSSVHIRVHCATTGDPLLDSLPILDGLKAAEALSGDPNAANQSSRREHFSRFRCDAHGQCTSSVTSLATPCGATPSQPPPWLGDEDIVGSGHTHPFFPVRILPTGGYAFRPNMEGVDSLPDNCFSGEHPPSQGNAPRPSPSDIQMVQSYDEPPFVPKTHYILDPESLHIIPGGHMSEAERRAAVVTIPRVQGACRII